MNYKNILYTNENFKDWISEWTFNDRDKNRLTHSMHKYPAIFIPELASKIINYYSSEGDNVLDIFCGSGTAVLESIANNRYGYGIELNPLANFISSVKLTPIAKNKLNSFWDIMVSQIYSNFNYKLLEFKQIEFWFDQSTINSISKFIHIVKSFNDEAISNFFLLCLSEIIRDISFCNHSGFKMHRNKKKLETAKYDEISFINKLTPVFNRNCSLINQFNDLCVNNEEFKKYLDGSHIFAHDTTVLNSNIGKDSMDLIITSPPYGDSRTTVAYGQFSRLSLQILGIDSFRDSPITQLDNELLGGKTKHVDPFTFSIPSITIQNVQELFLNRYYLAQIKSEKNRHLNRLKDILSFYSDLNKSIKNAHYYLKKNKYFVLVTASRVVHGTKLHTDQIIIELANNFGFKVTNIFYRDILNKRMPSKVSATNIKGETAPTMTIESIIVLKKMK